MGRIAEKVGQKFGFLTVAARAPERAPWGDTIWICDCELCGRTECRISGGNLRRQVSCGCLRGRQRSPMPLSQARLHQLLHYNPETGDFVWRVAKSRTAKPGDRAGCVNNKTGYLNVWVDGRAYKGHRLAWFYVHGHFPKQLDHINHDRADCRIANLREATPPQNAANSRGKNNTKSGLKGAWPYRRRWQAEIKFNGKRHHLGVFNTALEAHQAYLNAAQKLHGEFFYKGTP